MAGVSNPSTPNVQHSTMADRTGALGVVVTTDTSAVTGTFYAVTVLEDATFAAFSEDDTEGQTMTGFAVPAGVTLYGRITGYTLTSGKVRAYKG